MNEVVPCLIGHPFAPIGRGEDVRCTFRALRSAALPASVLDVYGTEIPDAGLWDEFSPSLVSSPGSVNIFHLNGDEIEPAFERLAGKIPKGAYNIIYPAWELSKYPDVWAKQLNRFDEVWAPSEFVYDALRTAVAVPVYKLPLASEVRLSEFRSRRYFGIPEAACAFLFFFDLRSYSTRKNPIAVVRAFEKLQKKHPMMDVCLVLKLHGADSAPETAEKVREIATDSHGRIILIDREISDNDVKNLVRCCDVFISLHRSEGFGRGLAEAMSLAKPVIATAYSGNLDFMDSNSACLVDFNLITVGEGEYPFYEGQVWADANVEQAAKYMEMLALSPTERRIRGARARSKVQSAVGFRVAGLRYRSQLERISGDKDF